MAMIWMGFVIMFFAPIYMALIGASYEVQLGSLFVGFAIGGLGMVAELWWK